MAEENKKTLPKDMDSDYSLPGRLEENNFEYLDTTTKDKSNSKILILCVVSFAIVSAAFFSYYFINQNEIDSEIMQHTTNMSIEDRLAVFYQVGKRGSEHSHAAMVIFVDEEMLNFGLPKFQLSSKYIHFENDDPHIIHKHATNVPMEMLFSSFGMKITSNCIILDQDDSLESKINSYCTKKDQIFSAYVNGEKYNSDISQYVLKHNDRIMIIMGDEKLISKQMKYLESIEIFDTPKKIPYNLGRDINL